MIDPRPTLPHPTVSAAILCGGAGRRMGGRDKATLPVNGRSILDRQLYALAPVTPTVRLIGRTAAAGHAGLPMMPDLVDAGALGGLYSALASSPTDHVLVLAGDLPFVTAAFLDFLAGRLGHDAVVPRDASGRHPLCALYHRRIAPVLASRIARGDWRIVDALDSLDVDEVGPDALGAFDPDGRLLLNVNTPDDYQRAIA